ncbi:MAG: shikimate kinase [Rhodospirillaceae bacterium]|nr:shikimate kinase [Rhodospirillaceae bacterium]
MLNPEQFVVLVGLMGAGKTSIGRRLADTLGIPFIDADEEIVNAAGCSIADIFEIYGEQAFREVEERVMARILSETPSVVATGGGAFINDQTRDLIARHSISVWLKADLKILLERTKRRDSRPILKAGDPQKILRELMETRYPIYAEADLTVETGEESVSDTLQGIMAALETLMPTDGAKPNEV